MDVKYKVKVNKLPNVSQTLETLNGRKVEIGAIQGDHAWLAGIHEYGCNIEVTPKMRAYLHAQGLHLSKDTKYIKIPERSFLRNGHDENAQEIMDNCAKAIVQVVEGKMSIDTFLDMCGQQFTSAIQDYATDLKKPPNHPFTIKQKGSSNPLVDSGQMIEQSISWRITK